jgi:hypothetical protein
MAMAEVRRKQVLSGISGRAVALGLGEVGGYTGTPAASAAEAQRRWDPVVLNPDVSRGDIRAGSAWSEVTPPPDAKEVASTPVFNAVVFSASDQAAAVLSVDAIGVGADFVKNVREAVTAKTGIPADHIMVGATHNHSVNWMMRGEQRGEREELGVNLLVKAFHERKPAAIVAGMHETPGYEYHRRLWGKDGFIAMNWEPHDPDLVPAGSVTTRMGFIGFEDEYGSPVGLILSHPCHNNCGGPARIRGGIPSGVTRDIGGYMGDVFRAHHGRHTGVVFLEAPCGDVNWCDSRIHATPPRYPEMVPYHGDTLAREIAGAWWSRCRPVYQTAPRVTRAKMVAHHAVLQIEERPLQPMDFVDPRGKQYERDHQWLAENGIDRKWPVEVQTIAIGETALASNPAELFSRFGRDIMIQSPFPVTLAVELANDSVGYIGTPEAIAQGGYEVLRKRHDKFAVDAGDRIVTQLVKMLRQSRAELSG